MGRNEIFMQKTIDNVLENAAGDTKVIAILDGYWPDPPIKDDPRVTIVHHTESIGQRAATNEGARISQAKYIMKLDAHCALDKGFDVKLAGDCLPDWTLIPQMYNLHAFDWVCPCGNRIYQGIIPEDCDVCHNPRFEMEIIWKPKPHCLTVSWRFDKNLQFQYWKKHHRQRKWKEKDFVETMTCIGACFFMERERFWELEGMDEDHGSWGQYGTELACKAWLSGGKMVTTRKTWFAHMFRTGNFQRPGHSSFPYELSNKQVHHARRHSQDIWLNNKWPKAKYNLEYLIDRFKPVPEWHDD